MVTDVSSEQTGPPSSGAAAPSWAEELLDVLEARRQVLITSAVALSLIGLVASVVAPGFVPPRALVGAAVGVAVVLLSVAITVAADSADLIVRGPRHVRAAGGRVAATLPMGARFDEADGLAGAIDERAEAGGRHWVALAPASRDVRGISDWADALGVCLSRRDRRVVVIDLYSGSTPGRAGVLEVVHDEVRLARAVDFDRELMLARLGAGADAVAALESLPGLVPRLPRDIEILVVALPPLGQPGALSVAGTLDRVLVFAETDQTTRVDLIASLDALDATDTASEVVLLEPARRTRAVPGPLADEPVDEPVAPTDDAADEAPEAVAPDDDPEPAPVAPEEPLDDEPVVAAEPTVEQPALDEPTPSEHVMDVPATDDGAPAPVASTDVAAEGETAEADPHRPFRPLDVLDEDDEDDADDEAELRATALLHQVADDPEPVAEPAPVTSAEDLGLEPWPEPEPEEPLARAAFEDTHEVLPQPIRDVERALDPQDRGSATVSVPDLQVGSGDDHLEHLSEAGRWAAPVGHEVLTGAAVERPRYEDDDDPLRVAAALQTLAQEVWSRDDERA